MIRIHVRNMRREVLTMAGWSKDGRGQYQHTNGRRVHRDHAGGWQIIGGPRDGTCWQSLNVAMHNAELETP